VVDDESPIREWVAYCIDKEENREFQVVAKARNGREGVELAFRHRPDLIITDIMMPGIDGLQMMKQILKDLPYTNFIILSNYAEFSYARTALAYGAKHYLLKSEMRASDLLSTIGRIHAEQEALLSGKKTDMYANGFLDIYDLYQNPDDELFSRSFMVRHSMMEDLPYCILGFEENNLFTQRQLLDKLIAKAQPLCGIPALQTHNILVFLQESSRTVLMEKAQHIASELAKDMKQNVAITNIHSGLIDIMDTLREAERLILAFFFYPRQTVLSSFRFKSGIALDRQQLWKISTDIFEALQVHDTKKTIDLLNPWLEQMNHVGLEDAQWAKEACLRMVFTLEERLYHTLQDWNMEKGNEPSDFVVCKERILSAACKLDESLCETYTQRIHKALHYIHEQYARPISLVEVADHVNLSAEYFSRLFKEKTGENFSVHLMMIRLQQAQKLLRETDYKVGDIANRIGYSSASHFSKLYKKYMGINPEDVRKTQIKSKSE
jgi:YesN/AraC family two-component response regulator